MKKSFAKAVLLGVLITASAATAATLVTIAIGTYPLVRLLGPLALAIGGCIVIWHGSQYAHKHRWDYGTTLAGVAIGIFIPLAIHTIAAGRMRSLLPDAAIGALTGSITACFQWLHKSLHGLRETIKREMDE